MPRNRRLDLPGVLHHVIVRGLEKREIFRDDFDREELLRRLELGLRKTKCKCYAWSLIPNHFHLLIRTGRDSLTTLMRRLLTGYAIYFNRKYNRHGYLYQNRFKSILCQEDTYFLELVRYVHLNPPRSGLVKNIKELSEYPWSGHSVLMGKKERDWQSTSEVLLRFDKDKGKAIALYEQYLQDGIKTGKRADLTGGGLKRSAGGWRNVLELKKNNEFWRGDERILGDGDFVNEVLNQAEEQLDRREKFKKEGWNLNRLAAKVTGELNLKIDDLKSKNRRRDIAKARDIFIYWGYNNLGISGADLAKFLNISRTAISKAIERSKKSITVKSLKLTS